MAENIGELKCKTIGEKYSFTVHFSFYKFRKHNTASGHHAHSTIKT
jgi:hypothetical protein